MPGIGIICNRNAGKHNSFRRQLGERLTALIGDTGYLRETSSIKDLENVANEFRDNDIDILGICGGDGSNHYILSTFVRVYGERPLPKVAFLCGGTHNAHAASIGIQGTPENLLKNIVQKHRTAGHFDLVRRHLLKVNDGTTVRYGFTLATGFMHRFMEDLVGHHGDSVARTAKRLFSWIGSWMVNGTKIRAAFALEPARVSVDQRSLPWDHINGVSASAMERLGLGFTPYPRAGEKAGYFPYSVMRVSPNTFLKLMWDYKKARTPTHPDQVNGLCASILMETENPAAYVLDGELYKGLSRFEITTGPGIDLIVS